MYETQNLQPYKLFSHSILYFDMSYSHHNNYVAYLNTNDAYLPVLSQSEGGSVETTWVLPLPLTAILYIVRILCPFASLKGTRKKR